MQRYGESRVEQVMLTEGWYRDNTGAFKAAFEDDGIEVPRHTDIVDDLRAFQMVRGVPRLPDKKNTASDGNPRHGDAGVALLLGHYASRRDVAPIEFQAVGKPRVSLGYRDYMG